MPIAAVPKYLGQDFLATTPGMRFGMYLPIWTDRSDQEKEVRKRADARSCEGQEVAAMLRRQDMDATIQALRQRSQRPLPGLWDKNDFAARQAWKRVAALSQTDIAAMKALLARQTAAAGQIAGHTLLRLPTIAVAPFTTGLGNEHPLENGFAFLNPYGLPYLPGSGVKGVLRQAARELASGEWENTHGWSEVLHYSIEVGSGTDRHTVRLSMLDVLFGREAPSGDSDHVRGALSFWDVIPQIQGESLMVEIMTPHQSHYYQQRPAAGIITPHDSGQPNPISFLTVPPGARFVFHVVCDLAHLRRLTKAKNESAPDMLAEGPTHWKMLLQAAFQHAFQWLGFGAKTAVGYGAMKPDRASSDDAEAPSGHGTSAAAPPAPHAAPDVARPARSQPAEEVWESVTITYNKGGGGVVTAQSPKGKAEARGQAASDFLKSLSEEQRRRVEKKGQLESIAVVVRVEGNMRTPVRLAPHPEKGPTG